MTRIEIFQKILEWIKTGIPRNIKSSNMRTLLTWINIRMDVQEPGRLKIVKIAGNTQTDQEVGDRISGIIENTPVVNGIYLGGNISLLSSYYVPGLSSNNPTENTYDDISDLISDQGSQTSGYNQRVLDASDDPEVSSGEAVYLFKGTANGLISDYIRLSESDIYTPSAQFEETIQGAVDFQNDAKDAITADFETFAQVDLNLTGDGTLTITPPIVEEDKGASRLLKVVGNGFDLTFAGGATLTDLITGFDNIDPDTEFRIVFRYVNEGGVVRLDFAQVLVHPFDPEIGITTDESLFLDPLTNELRGNIGQSTEVFVYTSGAKEFVLNNIPKNIIYITVNGTQLYDLLTQTLIDVPNKTIEITIPLDENDVININYQYTITT